MPNPDGVTPKKYIMQVVCRMGHVSEQLSGAPNRVLAGGICACPKCGARADWVRNRPLIVTTWGKGKSNAQPEGAP